MKKCPFCKEEIQDDAIKCRYCSEFLDSTKQPRTDQKESSSEVGYRGKIDPWPVQPKSTPSESFLHETPPISSIPTAETGTFNEYSMFKLGCLIVLAIIAFSILKQHSLTATILLIVLLTSVILAIKHKKINNTFKVWGYIFYIFAILSVSLFSARNKYVQAKQEQQQIARIQAIQEKKRQEIIANYETIKIDALQLVKDKNFDVALIRLSTLQSVKPNDSEIQELQKSVQQKIDALKKRHEDEATLKQKRETEKRELAKKTLKSKKQSIESLVSSYASQLRSPVGQLVVNEYMDGSRITSNMQPILEVNPIHSIRWLNSEQTKAKVSVTLSGKYMSRVSRVIGIVYATQEFQGGSFVCTCNLEGNCSITSE